MYFDLKIAPTAPAQRHAINSQFKDRASCFPSNQTYSLTQRRIGLNHMTPSNVLRRLLDAGHIWARERLNRLFILKCQCSQCSKVVICSDANHNLYVVDWRWLQAHRSAYVSCSRGGSDRRQHWELQSDSLSARHVIQFKPFVFFVPLHQTKFLYWLPNCPTTRKTNGCVFAHWEMLRLRLDRLDGLSNINANCLWIVVHSIAVRDSRVCEQRICSLKN